MSRRAQAVLLLAYALVVARLAGGSELLRYVRPSSRLLVLGAGLTIAVVALRALAAPVRPEDGPSPRAVWLLLAPLLALTVVAPPPLGALTANRRPSVVPRVHGVLAALPDADPVPLGLGDVVVRASVGGGTSLRGHVLRTVGFVSRQTRAGFVLTRLVITCCAADAEPNSVEVRIAGRPPPVDAWVRVDGRFVGMSSTQRFVPVLVAVAESRTAAPSDPYG